MRWLRWKPQVVEHWGIAHALRKSRGKPLILSGAGARSTGTTSSGLLVRGLFTKSSSSQLRSLIAKLSLVTTAPTYVSSELFRLSSEDFHHETGLGVCVGGSWIAGAGELSEIKSTHCPSRA